MFQKLAIAAAIAILKCKPPTLGTIDFCKIIQPDLREDSDLINRICTIEENNSLQNRFSATDFSQILNENNYSQPSCLQPSQVFQDIRDTISFHIEEGNSELLQNFETLQAISNIRRIICTMNGEHSFEGVTSNDFRFIENQPYSKGTQDSGYYSSQLSGAYAVYKRKDTGFAQLNASLKILINFMVHATNKGLNTSIVNYVSEIFGRSIDILYEHNVYLPSFDDVVDAIDSVMNRIFDKKQIIKISSQQKCVFTIVLLNKASLLIQHSLMQLIKELQCLLDKLLKFGPPHEVLEISDPNEIDSSFFIFQLLEGLLRQRVENKSKNVKRSEEGTSNKKPQDILKNNSMEYETMAVLKTTFIDSSEHLKKENYEKVLKERCMNLLNRAVLECVDTYPLISFWAMACLNIEN